MKNFPRYPETLLSMLLFTLVGWLAGCASSPDVVTSTPTGAAATRTPVPSLPAMTSTPKLAPSPTSIPATPTIPAPTPTLADLCPVREMGLPAGFLAPGMLVFHESEGGVTATGSEYKDTLYSLSPPDLDLHPFMEDLAPGTLWYFSVSPDGKWLAFRQERRIELGYIRELFVTTSDDQERKTIPWDAENWAGLKGWLANGQQLLILPRSDPATARQDKVFLFNPFTGQQQLVVPSFTYPQGSILDKAWGLIGSSVVYDPTFTRVVYLEDNDTMVLWDVENKQELWRFIEPLLMQDEVPTWSPGGKFFVLVDLLREEGIYGLIEGDEVQILLFSRDGELIWQSVPYPFYDEWFNSMSSFVWSPDERYLSFEWLDSESEEVRTFLLDTASMHILDYCLSDTATPVWSPDSQQFIVWAAKSKTPDGERTYQNLLVDMSKENVIQLEEITLRPVAWLSTDP